MKSIKTYVLSMVVFFLSCGGLAYADNTANLNSASEWHENFIHSRLDDLHGMLQLNAAQEDSWKKWSEGVMGDFREMGRRMDEEMMPPAGKHKLNTIQTTPERLEAYQDLLSLRLERLQDHIQKVKASAKRTLSFYSELDSKQKVIFDLYWSNWKTDYFPQQSMMHGGHGYPHAGMGFPHNNLAK